MYNAAQGIRSGSMLAGVQGTKLIAFIIFEQEHATRILQMRQEHKRSAILVVSAVHPVILGVGSKELVHEEGGQDRINAV